MFITSGDKGPGVLHAEAITSVHVDDALTVGTDAGLAKVTKSMEKVFEIKTKRDPTLVIGVQIERSRPHRWLKIHQEGFVLKLLDDEGMLDCNPASTPLDKGLAKYYHGREPDPEVNSRKNLAARKKFQELHGKLMWLAVKCRKDLLFLTNFSSRRLRTAGEFEYGWLRSRPLRYLNGTRDYGLVFWAGDDLNINGASDADFAGEYKSSRSTAGGFIKLGQYGTVMASSKLMRGVKTSTGHAETEAAAAWCKEEHSLRVKLREYDLAEQGRARCKIDNAGVVKQAINTTNHAQAKHYRVAQAYIREKCDSNEVLLEQTPTEDNPADFFTKALDKAAFEKHRATIMGPQRNPGRAIDIT